MRRDVVPKSEETGFAPTTTPAYTPSPSRSVARSAPAQVGRDHAVAVSAGSVPARPSTCEYVCRCSQIRLRPFIDHERPDRCVVGRADTDHRSRLVVQYVPIRPPAGPYRLTGRSPSVCPRRDRQGVSDLRGFPDARPKNLNCLQNKKKHSNLLCLRDFPFSGDWSGKVRIISEKHRTLDVCLGLKTRPQSSVGNAGVSLEPRSLHLNFVLKYFNTIVTKL